MRYKIDLKAFMADCEANYHRLCRLLPELDVLDLHPLILPSHGRIHIRVRERTPYTDLLEIHQVDGAAPGRWLQMPRLRVRLYHDARLAEVVDFDGYWRVRPRNAYPNQHMHQPDEKAQWNHFLAEWLAMASGHGYAAVSPCEFGTL